MVCKLHPRIPGCLEQSGSHSWPGQGVVIPGGQADPEASVPCAQGRNRGLECTKEQARGFPGVWRTNRGLGWACPRPRMRKGPAREREKVRTVGLKMWRHHCIFRGITWTPDWERIRKLRPELRRPWGNHVKSRLERMESWVVERLERRGDCTDSTWWWIVPGCGAGKGGQVAG